MTGDHVIQILISLGGALGTGLAVYIGMVRAITKLEVRMAEGERRLDRLEAPFFDHAARPAK